MKKETLNKLQQIMDLAVERGELAGGSLLVRQHGEEVCYLESGMADREENRPIERNQIYRLYSMSKPVTGAAAMKLFEEGKLDLAEPVSAFLPGFANPMVEENGKLVPARREVMVKDLLDMTSGLMYNGNPGLAGEYVTEVFRRLDDRLLTDNPMTTVELANELGKGPLAFHPGSSWLYGTSADMLGAVIEVVSGMRFVEYLNKIFFEPLHMPDTGFSVPKEKQDRLVTAYQIVDGEGLVPYRGDHLGIINNMGRTPAFESGGGGMVSTADDYARFGQMLLNGGELDGVRVLQPETVHFMTAGSLSRELEPVFNTNFPNMPGFNYGNLVRVMKYPGSSVSLNNVGEYGWDGWLGCYFANDPAAQRTIIFMMQRTDSGMIPLVRRLRNVIMSE